MKESFRAVFSNAEKIFTNFENFFYFRKPYLPIRFSTSGKCQSLSIPFCKNVPYNMTTFPNFFIHTTQEEASLEVHQLWPLVDRKCSRDVEFFFCSLYAPMCTTLDTPPLPCRELCLRVKSGCAVVLKVFRRRWLSTLACEKFPLRESGEVCVDRPQETSQLAISQSQKRGGEMIPFVSS